jgi:hypothetical protein
VGGEAVIIGVLAVATMLVLICVAIVWAGAGDGRAAVLTHRVEDIRPRVRLLSRLLFSRRQAEGITLDCLLLSVQQAGPGVTAPEGLPFTLQLRAPETEWFATRVEQLLAEWAADSRELLLELTEDHGKVRTMIVSNGASVHLELAGAAGLQLNG